MGFVIFLDLFRDITICNDWDVFNMQYTLLPENQWRFVIYYDRHNTIKNMYRFSIWLTAMWIRPLLMAVRRTWLHIAARLHIWSFWNIRARKAYPRAIQPHIAQGGPKPISYIYDRSKVGSGFSQTNLAAYCSKILHTVFFKHFFLESPIQGLSNRI